MFGPSVGRMWQGRKQMVTSEMSSEHLASVRFQCDFDRPGLTVETEGFGRDRRQRIDANDRQLKCVAEHFRSRHANPQSGERPRSVGHGNEPKRLFFVAAPSKQASDLGRQSRRSPQTGIEVRPLQDLFVE